MTEILATKRYFPRILWLFKLVFGAKRMSLTSATS